MATKSAFTRAFNALVEKKQTLTSKQIATRFGVSNPHDLVYRLRQEGVKVNRTAIKRNGKTTVRYSVA